MRCVIAVAFALMALPAGPVAAQETTPLQTFLNAADVNDFATMRSVMSENALESGRGEISLDRFFSKIDGCYLRRAYSSPESGILLAWMCAEGQNRSRVVIGDLSSVDGRIQVSISMEQTNQRPAPERTGSAFGGSASQ